MWGSKSFITVPIPKDRGSVAKISRQECANVSQIEARNVLLGFCALCMHTVAGVTVARAVI